MKASVVSPLLDRPSTDSAGLIDGAGRATHAAARHTLFSDLSELVKLRLSMLVVATTLAGFYAGWQGPLDVALLVHALIGTALAAAGASALNQVWEREYDALMRRTRERPIPGGRMSVETALILGVAFSLSGLLYLAIFTNLLAAALAAVTVAIYVFAYTPLKRKTTLNTLVGAVPGAIPPMIGWAVATGGINYGAWLLFALMFLWQMPHFLAIAWMYRDDYAQAGFIMLPGRESRRICHRAAMHQLLPHHLGRGPAARRGKGGPGYAWLFRLRVRAGSVLHGGGSAFSNGSEPAARSPAFPRVDSLSPAHPRLPRHFQTPMNRPFITPQMRRANLRLLIIMIIFAVALATTVLIWKYNLHQY